MIESSAALASPGTSAPMKGNILAPTGPAPASGELNKPVPGPVVKGANGKPTGPQYAADATKSPQQIRKDFESDRAARAANLKAEIVPGEGAGAGEEVAEPDASAVDGGVAQEGESEGKGIPAEAETIEARQARIDKAVAKTKSAASRHRQLQAEVQKRDMEMARMRQRTAELEAQARRGADFERAMTADPLKALEERGVSPEAIAKRILVAGTPEEKIALLQQQVEAQARRAEAVEKQARNEREQAQIAARRATAENNFVEAAADAERYPNLAGHPKEALLALGFQVAAKAKEKYLRDYGTDFVPTDRQILGYMNRIYAKAPVTETPATPSKAVAKPSGKASPKPASPRTMTSGQSAGSFTRPSNWDSLTRAQRVALMRKEVSRG